MTSNQLQTKTSRQVIWPTWVANQNLGSNIMYILTCQKYNKHGCWKLPPAMIITMVIFQIVKSYITGRTEELSLIFQNRILSWRKPLPKVVQICKWTERTVLHWFLIWIHLFTTCKVRATGVLWDKIITC